MNLDLFAKGKLKIRLEGGEKVDEPLAGG